MLFSFPRLIGSKRKEHSGARLNRPGSSMYLTCFLSSFFNEKILLEDWPILWEWITQHPITATPYTILFNRVIFHLHTSGIFKPDLMLLPCIICITKKKKLIRFIQFIC